MLHKNKRTSQQQPLVRVVDLDLGESSKVTLSNGQKIEVKLMNLDETRDPIRQAVRSAMVKVEVDGQEITLESGMYNLPRRVAGVQIDCSITKGYNSYGNARLLGAGQRRATAAVARRFSLAQAWLVHLSRESALVCDANMVRQRTRRWRNEVLPKIYYHSGLDIGGSEKQVKVIAATDAMVVSSGSDVLPEYQLEGGAVAKYGQGKSPIAQGPMSCT